MTHTLLVVSMLTTILAATFTAQAQTMARAYRVAWISPTPVAEVNPTFNAFREEMRQRGYVERETITFERRSVEAKPERIWEFVA